MKFNTNQCTFQCAYHKNAISNEQKLASTFVEQLAYACSMINNNGGLAKEFVPLLYHWTEKPADQLNHKKCRKCKEKERKKTIHWQFGKEVPHCCPRVWVCLPLISKTETETCYINLMKVVYKVTIQRQNIITKILFFLYEPSLDMSWSRFHLQDPQLILRSTTCLRNLPDFQTPRYNWIWPLQSWLTNPQEHTRSWRSKPLLNLQLS